MEGMKGFWKALIVGRYLCSQSLQEHCIEMFGLLGRERNDVAEFEQINVKMEFILVECLLYYYRGSMFYFFKLMVMFIFSISSLMDGLHFK